MSDIIPSSNPMDYSPVEAKSFTVVRSKWSGRDANIIEDEGKKTLGWTGLWNSETDEKCCLGFYAEACGYTKQVLLGRGMTWFGKYVNAFVGADEGLATAAKKAANINDDITIPQSEKEAKLIALFAEHGITLNFVDE